MTLWMVFLGVLFVAAVVGLYFGTKRNMDEGLTPPGPVDPKDLFDGEGREHQPDNFEGESEMELESQDAAEEARNLGG